MKKFALSIFVALAICITAAVAQSTGAGGNGSQGTRPQSSPGMQQPGSQPPSAEQPTPQQPGTMSQDQNTTGGKAERKLKGCIQSQGGQYVLETKKGKAVALTGKDVSAHVGHEVAVKGNWEAGGSAGMSPSSSGGTAGAEKTFNVTDIEHISDTCGGKSSKGSSSMGTPPTGTNPSGTGSSTGGSTTPPQ